MLSSIFNRIRAAAAKDLTLVGLKTAIVVWALFVIALTLATDNKWVLAGILAYEVLP